MLDLSESVARRRGLRGMAIHLLPQLRRINPAYLKFNRYRSLFYSFPKVRRGTCRWCMTPTTEPRRWYWHETCVAYYLVTQGRGMNTLHRGTPAIIPRIDCVCGAGYGNELDHIIALGVAARQGVRQYARALLPENLQWLCFSCHHKKTGQDRKLMTQLDKEAVDERSEC